MKTFVLFLLFASLPCCFGQTDTNLLATGDWSEAVTDQVIWRLRGRLLVYDSLGKDNFGNWQEPRVYVELENVTAGIAEPIEIHFDTDVPWPHMHFEVCDASGQPLPKSNVAISRMIEPPFTATLPSDSAVRLRADLGLRSGDKPDGFFRIGVVGGNWRIPFSTTNSYFLSATFSPPTNNAASLGGHVWHGILKLPKVKIPVKQP